MKELIKKLTKDNCYDYKNWKPCMFCKVKYYAGKGGDKCLDKAFTFIKAQAKLVERLRSEIERLKL